MQCSTANEQVRKSARGLLRGDGEPSSCSSALGCIPFHRFKLHSAVKHLFIRKKHSESLANNPQNGQMKWLSGRERKKIDHRMHDMHTDVYDSLRVNR